MKENNLSLLRYLRTGFCCSLVVSMIACGGTDTVEDADTIGEETAVMEEAETDWDSNRFNESFTSTGRFGGWDENEDSMLDENEYNNSYYDTWDINNDNFVDEDEWNNASRDFGMENKNMTDWDTNRDKRIDQNEFRTGSAQNSNYRNLDKDGDNMLNEREYSDGIFGTWDNDRDGAITDEEYNTRFNRYYGGSR